MASVPMPRPVTWQEAFVGCLRRGDSWEQAKAQCLPPGWGSLASLQQDPRFQRAYAEGEERRRLRQAFAEARREVESWFTRGG